MIVCDSVTKREIRTHYDRGTPFYWLFWGRHIHHGLWQADESPQAAQQRLTDELIRRAAIESGQRVLDVGCGMGGSSIHLARAIGCQVTGITLSPVQRAWASTMALMRGVGRRTSFHCQDAETADFPPQSFDVVWSVECTEHLFDKGSFFQRAAGWLRPGGRMAICAWLACDVPRTAEQEQRVFDVCEGFLCPSLGSAADYDGWFRAAGLEPVEFDDWTDQVSQTWEICLRRVNRSGVRHLARPFDAAMTRFLDRFRTILDAYRTGAMRYGCFIYRKPMLDGGERS
jgi:tocopherol O-methyltransferase